MPVNKNNNDKMKVVISGGSYKFHLSPLAAEIAKNDQLGRFITAGWPNGWQRRLAQLFPNSASWTRFLDRHELIPHNLVCSIPITELIFKLADIFLRTKSEYWQQKIKNIGYYLYSAIASSQLKKVRPEIYHYRNCYGNQSVDVARKHGALVLCDHSIAHPICLDWMEKHEGDWPDINTFNKIRSELNPLYKNMEEDILRADFLIVNSEFVKRTCVYVGMNPNKIYVAYLGVDSSFINALAGCSKTSPCTSKNSLLYAGGWQRRKGVKTLVDGLSLLDNDWSLDIAGGSEPETLEIAGMNSFLTRPNIKMHGILPREKLASLMKSHRIFVFPSYCEGSARVVFEAMAAGCFIITTANAGSIVEDGVHGRLIEAGSFIAIKNAIEEAFSKPKWVEEVGLKNAALITKDYCQRAYGNRVMNIYQELSKNRFI